MFPDAYELLIGLISILLFFLRTSLISEACLRWIGKVVVDEFGDFQYFSAKTGVVFLKRVLDMSSCLYEQFFSSLEWYLFFLGSEVTIFLPSVLLLLSVLIRSSFKIEFWYFFFKHWTSSLSVEILNFLKSSNCFLAFSFSIDQYWSFPVFTFVSIPAATARKLFPSAKS